MAESEKGPVSTANIKKKSSSFDEDFGKDFLSPWKTSKLGKDPIDFDVETISGNGKGFNFDKLDDFEFGGDFDKISSFKMDMSDLDFSSPLKKAEKPNEEPCKDLVLGKKEPRKENFSFTFDFNELSMFGLDPKLVTSENEATKPIDGISTEDSVNHDKELISRSNSAMKTDKVESDEIQALPKKASMDSSKLTHLIEQDSVKSDDPSASSNLSCNNMCCEAQVSTEIHTLMTQENAEDKRFSEEHGKAADDSLSAKPFAEKTAQHFSLISVSCDDLVQPTLPKMLTEVSTSEPGKANLGREQDNSVRSIASSQSRNSSPVNSHNSRAWQSAYKSESPITSSEFQKDEGNKKEIVRSASRELIEHTKDLASTSDREFSDRSSHGAKNEGEKQNSNPKLLPLPLHRDLIQVKYNHRKGKGTFLLSNPLSISTEKVTRPNPALTSKQLHGVDLYSTDRNKEPKQTDEQAENKKPATQGAPDVIGTEREDLISSFQPQSSNLVGPTITSTTTKNLMPNIISNCKFMKNSRSVSSELQGTSPKDGKQALLSSLAAFRIRKLNGNSPSSCLQQEAKPKEVLEGNKGTPTTSEVTTSAIKKHALLSPPLKRKIVEVFVPEQDVLNSATFIMKSPTKRRKSPDIATRSTSEMVLGGENLESFNPIPLNSSHEIGGLLNFEVPILVENDGNVEKAEACARELDDICSMLKKKNEEAKELLVRAVVNNNALLMLNHPMFEEKIRALQKFATSLHSKYSSRTNIRS